LAAIKNDYGTKIKLSVFMKVCYAHPEKTHLSFKARSGMTVKVPLFIPH